MHTLLSLSDLRFYRNPSHQSSGSRWTHFKSKSLDYFHIDTNYSEMRTFLRPEKVTFWNELIPSMLAQLSREGSKSGSHGNQGASFWILVIVCTVLLLLVLASLVFITRIRSRYREMNPAPTRV